MKTKTIANSLNSPNKRNWLKFLLFFVTLFFAFNISFGSWSLDNPFAFSQAHAAGEFVAEIFLEAIDWLLQGLFVVLAKLLFAAGILFDYVVDPNILRTVLNAPGIYAGWSTVRDLVNLAFILILLFSAFCTVFQIDKYSIKKVLLNLVLMALLINFSFPISRFIIDTANVPMYFFIDNLHTLDPGTSISAKFVHKTGYSSILMPPNLPSELKHDKSANIQATLVNIVFTFILMITLLSLGLMLLIRVFTLAILVMFAPFGFMPSVMGSHGSKWWSKLMENAFFGPMAAFMLYFSYSLMQTLNGETVFGKIEESAGAEGSNWIGSLIYFILPVVLLWMTIGYAKSSSAIGSSVVMGKAEKFGKWAGGAVMGAAYAPIKATGIPGGIQKGAKEWQKRGIFGSNARDRREAKISGFMNKGKKGWNTAANEAEKKMINERLDELKKTASTQQLISNLDSRDTVLRVASARALSENDTIPDSRTYSKIMDVVSDQRFKDTMESIKAKAKKDNNMHFVLAHELGASTTPAARTAAIQKVLGGLSMEKLGEQKGIHDDAFLTANADVTTYLAGLSDSEKAEAMKKMPKKGRNAWANQHIV